MGQAAIMEGMPKNINHVAMACKNAGCISDACKNAACRNAGCAEIVAIAPLGISVTIANFPAIADSGVWPVIAVANNTDINAVHRGFHDIRGAGLNAADIEVVIMIAAGAKAAIMPAIVIRVASIKAVTAANAIEMLTETAMLTEISTETTIV